MAFWKKRQEPEKQYANLHEAVEAGDYVAVKRFLSEGTNPNAQDGRNATALHIAAARGHLEIAKLLVTSGAVVDFLIQGGGTPLMAASACLQPTLVQFLLSSGAQPNKLGQGGRSPLECPFQPDVFAVARQLQCIDLLVANGAKINQRTDDGGTPLMSAAWFGNKEAVDRLLKLGADATLYNNRGRTAAMLAFERGHDELAKLLKHSADHYKSSDGIPSPSFPSTWE